MVPDALFTTSLFEGIVDAACVEGVSVVESGIPCMDKHFFTEMIVEYCRLAIGVVGGLKVEGLEMVAHPDKEWIIRLHVDSIEVMCTNEQVGL